MPCARAWTDSVARMSSASNCGLLSDGMCIVSRTRSITATCPLNGAGVASRLPLYASYTSVRNVVRPASKATATCVGASSRSRFAIIEKNPNTALVGSPADVANLSTGSAKNAR